MLKGFIDCDAIWVDFISSFKRLYEIHFTGVPTNLTIGETVHPATGMLPFSSREKVTIPGVGHFVFRVIIPIFSPSSAGVVADFSDGDGGVTVPAEVGRE